MKNRHLGILLVLAGVITIFVKHESAWIISAILIGGGTGIFLKSPDVFSLRYLHKGADHPFLNSFKLCALTGLNVNYTNAGTYASYDGGTPVNIRMNMTFKELNPIYSEDYEGMGDNDGVGF